MTEIIVLDVGHCVNCEATHVANVRASVELAGLLHALAKHDGRDVIEYSIAEMGAVDTDDRTLDECLIRLLKRHDDGEAPEFPYCQVCDPNVCAACGQHHDRPLADEYVQNALHNMEHHGYRLDVPRWESEGKLTACIEHLVKRYDDGERSTFGCEA